MKNDLEEQILKFIKTEQAINESLEKETSREDYFMFQFIVGKKTILERLEALLRNS